MSVDAKKLSNAQWDLDSVQKMVGWKGDHLVVGNIVTLVYSSLSRIPLFMISFLEEPRGVLKSLAQ